jgi:hypothetical protein
MVLAVLHLYNQDIERTKEQDDDDKDNDNLEVNKEVNDQDEMDQENFRTSAMVILEQISNKDESTDPVEAIEGLLKTIRAVQDAKQKVRLSLVLGGAENLEEDEYEIRHSSFPILSMVGLPVTKRLVSSLLREIVALSSLNPDNGLLSYETHRGTSCELLRVIRSKNKSSFATNVRRHQSWLHRLPSLVVPQGVDPSVGASWILQHLALNFEDEFVHVCKKMGYPVFSKKMDAATACAMW